MSKLFRTPLSDWIRGAQSTIHEGTMFVQSIIQTFVIAGGFLVIVVGWFSYSALTPYERHLAYKWGEATVSIALFSKQDRIIKYVDENGVQQGIRAQDLYASARLKQIRDKAFGGALRGGAAGGAIIALTLGALFGFFHFTGIEQGRDHVLRGTVLTDDTKALQKKLRAEGKAGPIEIGGVRLPHKLEVSHMMFLGGPGTGKSQQMRKALAGIREAGRRAIVYDINGTYLETFYREGRDIILNPLDARAPAWNLWSEVRHPADYDQIAAALIPEENEREKFWPHAAQLVFREAAKLLEGADPAPTNEALIELLMRSSLQELVARLRNTDAASVIDESNERTAAAVRAVLSAKMGGFTYLGDRPGPVFSIKDFILDEGHDRWLFITSSNTHLAALKSLISLWVDIAVNTTLSLPPNPERRLYYFFDELASLSRLPSLENAMAQSRKHGGSIAIGFQSIAQLRDVYGPKNAEAITGNCATWSLLRLNDTETAEWGSKALGVVEKTETSESLSIAKHEIGDRRTIQKQLATRPTVLPAELRQLRDLEGYLLLGRGYPILQMKLAYESRPIQAAPFVRYEAPAPVQPAPEPRPNSPLQPGLPFESDGGHSDTSKAPEAPPESVEEARRAAKMRAAVEALKRAEVAAGDPDSQAPDLSLEDAPCAEPPTEDKPVRQPKVLKDRGARARALADRAAEEPAVKIVHKDGAS